MTKATNANTLQLAAAAAAVIVATSLTAPIAAAIPVFPLAPACNAYKMPAFTNFIAGDTTVFIGWAPDGKSGRANTGGYGSDGSFGDVTGGLNGRHAEFLVHWDQGPLGANKWQYSGDVGDDLSLSGTVRFGGVTQGWRSDIPVECVAPNPDTGPPTGQKTAKVVSDVDVYDHKNEPDGAGQFVGILRSPNTVQLLGPCQKKAWCNVSGDAVPTGSGWVWGALDF
jgi:hypothetical protein